MRSAAQRYYRKNRESILARQKDFYAANPGRQKENRRRWRNANPERHRFGCYQQHAKARGVEFALSFEQAYALMHAPCVYCGVPPLNGIDRIDSGLGYTPENCESCCAECNLSKGTRTKGEFLAWLLRVAPRFR